MSLPISPWIKFLQMNFIGKAYKLPTNSMRPRDQVLSHSISLEQTSDVTTVKKETLSFLCLLSSKIPRKEQICHVRASSVYSVELPTTLKDPAYSGKYQKTINIVVVGNGRQRSVLQMFQDALFLQFFKVFFVFFIFLPITNLNKLNVILHGRQDCIQSFSTSLSTGDNFVNSIGKCVPT